LENPNPGVSCVGSAFMEDKKVVLVTGASSGLGRAIAALLFQKGYKVYGTSRKPPKESYNSYEILQLDVNSDESVNACIASLMTKAGRIDVLINNAGFVTTGAMEEMTIDQSKSIFETNFFGALRMVNAVLPIMRKQGIGKIINVGSLAGTIPVPFQGMYAATKAALLTYSDSLRQELKNLNIKVSIIEPGFFNTEIMENNPTETKSIDVYKKNEDRTLLKLSEVLKKGGDPRLVAETALKIVENPAPRFRYPVGKEKTYLLLKRLAPESIFESNVRNYWELDKKY
jgi:short-subunit dehydrogenase